MVTLHIAFIMTNGSENGDYPNNVLLVSWGNGGSANAQQTRFIYHVNWRIQNCTCTSNMIFLNLNLEVKV